MLFLSEGTTFQSHCRLHETVEDLISLFMVCNCAMDVSSAHVENLAPLWCGVLVKQRQANCTETWVASRLKKSLQNISQDSTWTYRLSYAPGRFEVCKNG